ncbi:flagellar basal-body MS-ring/collar protein FliF [Paludibacterium paludis]|uniref:Flagellar M-ring protein n=1 Tax=Paludibacterium paludis TaxID=1225769 RepID=A0A918P725_9NEIS|nr:flagellar basal-body MS-ring/collar protein FliF [Paludibacterium paludis]GGY28835.1 flagellar M-ring protein [Paludibacterium paludis]
MIEFIRHVWARRRFSEKAGLTAAVLVLTAGGIGAFFWLGRSDYQALFSGMEAKDAAAVVASLEKQKIPYQLADEGKTVLVDKGILYRTRMKLVAGGLDLKNSVGLEIFNNAEFGATEFAQKINYQRAMQGELARTIQGFDEVQNARVHLVLPENGLLRRRNGKAKASVWVTLKGDKTLSPDQVSGIQRLVAASVSELEPGAVTVLDQKGVALSPRDRGDDVTLAADGQLQLKKDTEAYLQRKVNDILDEALGPNQGVAGVDVILDASTRKLTREAVLGNNGESNGTGVMVRKREQRQPGDPSMKTGAVSGIPSTGGQSLETEYQVGKEVWQMLNAPGTIRRISVGVVTGRPLPDGTVEQLRNVIAMTVGLDLARGDSIAFSFADRVAPEMTGPDRPGLPSAAGPRTPGEPVPASWLAAGLAVLAGVVGAVFWTAKRRRRDALAGMTLSEDERAKLLRQLREWLDEEGRPATGERP